MEERRYRYNSSLRRRASANVAKRLKIINQEQAEMLDTCRSFPIQQSESSHGNDESMPSVAEAKEPENEPEDAGNQDYDENFFSSPESDSNSDNSEFEEVDKDDLADTLAEWALQYFISLAALSSLLVLLRRHHPSLPKDARTLLKTNRSYTIEKKAGGSYYYFGILSALINILEKVQKKFPDKHTFKLQLNIDGLPLYKSSNMQFWPILGMLQDVNVKRPVVIGLFSGIQKPNSLEEFLGDLVKEIKLLQTGFELYGKTFYLLISSVMCDAPARAYVKGIKSHTGYYGCDKCIQSGEHILRRMTFPENDARLRTDQSFESATDEDHHTSQSPFQETYLGMVSQFPHDYMHLVCLGVMRRLLGFWMKGPLQCRLPALLIQRLSEKLVSLRDHIPAEFARKPRSMKEVSHWKATEFRQFLLYTGPVVLNGILNSAVYKNFMLFFVGIFVLCSPRLSVTSRAYAHSVLVLFIEHYSKLYGREMVVYNIHGLVHLAKDVEIHGHLDLFSCFPFENYLGKLKKLVRKPHLLLAQVVRRISEHNVRKETEQHQGVYFKKQHCRGPLPQGLHTFDVQYEEAFLKDFCIKLSTGDNCVSFGKQIVLIRNIVMAQGRTYIVYEEFERKVPYFDYPLDSSLLGIYLLSALSGELRYTLLDEKVQKYVLLPCQRQYVGVPLLHLG